MQWANINSDYNKSMRQKDKGFTTSEDDDDIEKDLNDVTVVEKFKGNTKANKERVSYQQTHSPVIRGKQKVSVNSAWTSLLPIFFGGPSNLSTSSSKDYSTIVYTISILI